MLRMQPTRVVKMGTIVLSSGTSVPNSLSSIIVARKGEGDMAIANVLGSNIFNIFVCLGFSWMLWNIVHGVYESPALRRQAGDEPGTFYPEPPAPGQSLTPSRKS